MLEMMQYGLKSLWQLFLWLRDFKNLSDSWFEHNRLFMCEAIILILGWSLTHTTHEIVISLFDSEYLWLDFGLLIATCSVLWSIPLSLCLGTDCNYTSWYIVYSPIWGSLRFFDSPLFFVITSIYPILETSP